jgi:hypothetical protein
MLDTSDIVLPYEPGYTAHRDAEKRREETRRWLEQREKDVIDAPSLAPGDKTKKEKEPA